jgi:hypothetical protein
MMPKDFMSRKDERISGVVEVEVKVEETIVASCQRPALYRLKGGPSQNKHAWGH